MSSLFTKVSGIGTGTKLWVIAIVLIVAFALTLDEHPQQSVPIQHSSGLNNPVATIPPPSVPQTALAPTPKTSNIGTENSSLRQHHKGAISPDRTGRDGLPAVQTKRNIQSPQPSTVVTGKPALSLQEPRNSVTSESTPLQADRKS